MEKTRQLVMVLLALSTSCIAADNPNRQWMTVFQEAQYQEQTAGNLDKAIELYQQVLTEAAQVEKLAARAAFQLGVCHQKKGDTAKAAEYFRQVVTKYPDQKLLAGRAQEMLNKIAPASAQPSGNYVIHYKTVDPSQEGLTLLNKIMPEGVRTFRANKYRADGQTIDSICTDSEESKNKIVEAINASTNLKLVKIESPQQMTGIYKQKLEQPVSVNVSQSPDGDRLTIQYAAIAIAEAAGVPYQWDKSAQLAHPQRTRYIEPLHVDGKTAAQALIDLLTPVELEYGIDGNGLYLCKPSIVGRWQSVDFVSSPDQFQPDKKQWKGDMFLKEATFNADGSTSHTFRWTEQWVYDAGSNVKVEYYIKIINGEKYLFLPWLSGDVTTRGQKPHYYVLRATASKPEQQPTEQEKRTEQAVTAAQAWLELIDKGQYAESWDTAAAFFKKAVTQSQWTSTIPAVRKPMGNLLSREVLSSTYTRQLPGVPDGEYVVIQFKTSFENKKDAVETITPMLDTDGQWRVGGYLIK